tara:strand:- start:2524 stop:2835 length:312 start_codon:yes stop_codon:yes gene_type:complete
VLKISEVHEKQVKVKKERADGSEYINFEKVYDTRECLLNTEYVVSVHPYEFSSSADLDMMEGRFPEGTKFSTFVLDGNSFRTSEIVVVGSFDKFCRLLQENNT